jgi:hypothetical protein
VLDVVGSGGAPLEGRTRAEMESSFGHDFGDVRIHTDSVAVASAESVQARAYTVGNDIVFGGGGYAPETNAGRHTLAHELAHVVQQRSGPVDATQSAGGIAVSHPSDRFEVAAEATAAHVAGRVEAEERVIGPTRLATDSSVQRRCATQVQRQGPVTEKDPPSISEGTIPQAFYGSFQAMLADSAAMYKVKDPIARSLAKEYVGALPPETPGVEIGAIPMGYGEALPAKVIKGYRHPSEDRIYLALYNQMDLKKTGHGYRAEDWTWKDEASAPQPEGGIGKELVTGLAEIYYTHKGIKLVEEQVHLVLGTVSATLEGEGVAVLASIVRAGARGLPVVGWAITVWELIHLAESLNEEPVDVATNSDSDIAAKVRAYLSHKQRWEAFLKDPVKVDPATTAIEKDATSVSTRDPVPYSPLPKPWQVSGVRPPMTGGPTTVGPPRPGY